MTQMKNNTLTTWTIGNDSPSDVCLFLQQQADAGVTIFCFDYFDTLVVREIEPEFTKQLAARLHSQLLYNLLPPERLYAMRQQLERVLCEHRAASGGELEFYLDSFAHVYRALLREELGDIAPLRDADRFAECILSIETAVEKIVQQPCQDVMEVLAWLRERGMSTVLISDFYLPGRCFDIMLENMGIDEQFDHVFVSADYALAKSSGRLYEKVCETLNCEPEQMLMIGDNPDSDVVKASEKGLGCLYLMNPRQKAYYAQWRPDMLTEPTRMKPRFTEAVSAEGVFKEMSSTLWCFVWKLFEELRRKKVRDVFFFSKEGEFLKKLFDRLQDDLFGCRVIRSHYLLVSRKATFLASLRPLDAEDFSRLFAYYRDISPRDFLLSLNIEESAAASLCEEVGVDYQARLPDLQNRPEFRRLLNSEPFRHLYETRRTDQQKNFITYLDSFGVDYTKDGLTIVDVGWKGSIQDNIYNILRGCVRMQGYYAGFLIAAEKQERNRKRGILFDNTCPQLPHFNVYNNNRSLFEMMLGASHGSADGYFTPEQFARLPDDHQREVRRRVATEDGELLIATLDLPEERKLFAEKIRPLQEQMYADAGKLNRAFLRSGCSLPEPEWFARRHARMVFTPTLEEIEFFERLYHLENFGIFEYTDFRTEEDLSLRRRWRNLVEMRKNPAVLEMGTWPPIILRRLGLDFYRHINGYRRYRREFK
jgi:FMN phosphatase YigB (HAD superfamily)